jgi:hypothetical protein
MDGNQTGLAGTGPSLVSLARPERFPALFSPAEKLISFALAGECGRHFYGVSGEKTCRIVINAS